MNKHAYLILVQNQPELLEYQLPLLDHARVDLYPYRQKQRSVVPESLKSLVKESKNLFLSTVPLFHTVLILKFNANLN